MIMCKTTTEKQINTMWDKVRAKKLLYFIKNCSSYKVSYGSENEHWLCGSIIVTHWAHDTGYSRKYYGLAYPDNFETWSFHNDILASEAFTTHMEDE